MFLGDKRKELVIVIKVICYAIQSSSNSQKKWKDVKFRSKVSKARGYQALGYIARNTWLWSQ